MPTGTSVFAADDGLVTNAGTDQKLKGFGNFVRIEHPDGSKSYYAHMSTIAVGRSIPVTKGTFLGSSGNTGNSTNPHLHFQVLDVNGLAVPIRTIEGITWVNANDLCAGGSATFP
jgi:murein DD-endopeptidase MepM/ murein hydrolase activator NlpD